MTSCQSLKSSANRFQRIHGLIRESRGWDVSKLLLGSLVTLARDITSQKSVWLTVAEGALIVKYRSSYFLFLHRPNSAQTQSQTPVAN